MKGDVKFMETSKIAVAITGLDNKSFREHETPRLVSKNQLVYVHEVPVRGSVRVVTGLIVTSEDLAEERRALEENVPPALDVRNAPKSAECAV